MTLRYNQCLFVLRVSSLRPAVNPTQPATFTTTPPCMNVTRSTAISVLPTRTERRDVSASTTTALHSTSSPSTTSAYSTLGGLDEAIAAIRTLVELPLLSPELFRSYNLSPPRGVLLYGPPGTGKTSLARAAARSTGAATLVINGPELSSAYHGETEAKLRALFEQAKRRSPCVVVIDEIDALAPRRDADAGGGGGGGGDAGGEGAGEVERRVVATLLTLLDGVDLPPDPQHQPGAEDDADADAEQDDESEHATRSTQQPAAPRVVVIAATNRPNAIDPALRRPGRLDREIEIGIPTSSQRAAILSVQLRGVPHDLTAAQIELIAGKTHGYVGADLGALVREAGMRAIRRAFEMQTGPRSQEQPASVNGDAGLAEKLDAMQLAPPSAPDTGHPASAPSPLHLDDLLEAMSSVKASALREIAFETPNVYWKEIAGGTGTSLEVQSKLRESVEWPLRHPEAFARLGVDAPKGVLLYGPPGCSKTLMAKALATESGLNFIAVKGPELFNKFVGESERAVRETFRKARLASPCIVFFDEIDALTTTRGADGDGGASGPSDRVIGTLLNEMDGVSASGLAKVVVVAATNRPEVIDPALLRPGRFDRLLYVPPPDHSARLQMLQHRAVRMRLASDVDLASVAERTQGCSGAEVISICQDAGLIAMSRSIDAEQITAADVDKAVSQVRRRITPEMLRKFEHWRDAVAA